MKIDCTIGEAAKTAGVGVETIRFYERRKLLARPLKPKSGARRYSDEAIARLGLIKQLQRSGFSLKEVASILRLKDQGRAGCTTLAPIISGKITALRDEIKALERILGSLEGLVANCQSDEAECPALSPPSSNSQETANGRNRKRTRLHARPRRAHTAPR
jgi:MerR family mercuric resistance operon transcriptional regulator